MIQKEKQRLRKKWRRQLKIIQSDLSNLLTTHEIMWDTVEIYKTNPQLKNKTRYFLKWMFNNYVVKLSVGIRRVSDPDKRYKRAISLYRLIDDIKNHSGAIDRGFYVRTYPKHLCKIGSADRDYDAYAGKGNNALMLRYLESDLRKIEKNTIRIKSYVNKWIAHTDFRKRIKKIPTGEDAGLALKVLDELYCKYNKLLNRSTPPTAKPSLQFCWKEPLRVAWLDEDRIE